MSQTDVYLGREPASITPAGLKLLATGKVRDIYEIDARHLLFVTTDRVSAFDVVMREGIPHKGRVLTAISAWWFEHTRDVVENHLVSTSVDDVPGVGPVRKRALLRRFGSLKGIREAEVDELTAVPGMSRSSAEAVKAAL